jgi:hypothetical protein
MCKIQWSLKNDLKKFGLNPTEWTIRELNEQKFKIAHVKDQHFCFVGDTHLVGAFQRWTNLKLISF